MTRMRSFGFAIAFAFAGAIAFLLACGPESVDLVSVTTRGPADERAYANGQLGIVRPAFSLGYLLQAYRTLAPQTPVAIPPATVSSPADAGSSPSIENPVAEWIKTSVEVLGPQSGAPGDRQNRQVPGSDYQTFLNCPDAAFASAVETLRARAARFGAGSAQLRDWVRAQIAVFENCHDGPPVLPVPAAGDADALTRADRAYQTAAAYFYAMDYDQAVTRFHAIAADRESAWRSSGRYLAARASIRFATVPTETPAEPLLREAEEDLRGVLSDPAAAALHPSARGLLGFVGARLHPVDRLHELSKRLTAPGQLDDQDFYDYRFIFNRVRSVDATRSEIVRDDDLTDWLLTLSDSGESGAARAIERWRATRKPHWLVAALWHDPAQPGDAEALLDAAKLVDRRSAAFPTVAFLRVRLLARLDRANEARAVLASLPTAPTPDIGSEAINLFKAERLMVAENLDQFLANAPRAIVVQWGDPYPIPNGRLAREKKSHDQPVFDEDAAAILAEQFPLTRLVDAALGPRLPRRLRLRVAMAALTRAMVLRRDEAGVRLVPLLRDLAPALRADLDRYARATTSDERHSAGLRLLLNTPGATVDVRGLEDDFWFEIAEPARQFDHVFRRNWWCEVEGSYHSVPWRVDPSETVNLVYANRQPVTPAFLTPAERAAAAKERRAILAAGPPMTFLGRAAIDMAKQQPTDPALADALARVVEGWRYTCHDRPGRRGAKEADDGTNPLPQQAFTLLHRLFPKSEAAQRTPYWYRD